MYYGMSSVQFINILNPIKMKERINLSKINQFELQNDTLNSIRAGEAGVCDFACGCSCACQTGDTYTMNNTANDNATSTESGGATYSGVDKAIDFLLGKF